MSEEIITQPESTAIVPHESKSPVVQKEDGNVAVTALQPMDMPRCQSALIEWARHKVATIESDERELAAAVDHARKRKWKLTTLQRHWNIAKHRLVYYRKILAALEAGYVIVPNFPVSLFAIRKQVGDKPHSETRWTHAWQQLPLYQQQASSLPAGEGVFQNPFPYVFEGAHSLDEKKNEIVPSYPTAWKDIDFPVTMAKPEIMEAATTAMTEKLFDQLGILPARIERGVRVKGDPIIIGQIVGPKSTVSFMLAWHLDTREL